MSLEYFTRLGLDREYRSDFVPCEICGGVDFLPITDRGRIAGPTEYGHLPIRCCSRCGFLMLNPRFESAFYVDYYRRFYQKVTNAIDEPSDEDIQSQIDRGKVIADYLSSEIGMPPGKMLDLGCAAGMTMMGFKERNWDVSGVDPDATAVGVGQRMGMNVVLGEAENLAFEPGTFDLVITLGTTEHCFNLTKALSSVRRVLKTGGRFFIRYRSQKIWGSPLEYFNHNHYRYYTTNTLSLLLWRHGFTVEKFEERELEGWTGASYAVARATHDAKTPAEVAERLAKTPADSAEERRRYFTEKYREARDRATLLKEISEKSGGDPDRTLAELKRDPRGIRILGGSPKAALARALREAEALLKEKSSPIADDPGQR